MNNLLPFDILLYLNLCFCSFMDVSNAFVAFIKLYLEFLENEQRIILVLNIVSTNVIPKFLKGSKQYVTKSEFGFYFEKFLKNVTA